MDALLTSTPASLAVVAPQSPRVVRLQPGGRTALFIEDPDLLPALPDSEVELVVSRAVVDVVHGARGTWDAAGDPLGCHDGAVLLVMSGAVVLRTGAGTRLTAEVLGPGDILRRHDVDTDEIASVPVTRTLEFLESARLLRIQGAQVGALRRVPGTALEVEARDARRRESLALRLAVLRTPNLCERLRLILWHLADRWGIRTGDGVRFTIPLAQALLADLAGAQRTSVNAALRELEDAGHVVRLPRTVMLTGERAALCGPAMAELA